MPIMSNHSLKRKLFVSPPPPPIVPLIPVFTRDSDSPTIQSKKAKKNQTNKSAAVLALDVGDRMALNKRAERFRREHELEKQKQNGGGGQASSLRANQRTAHPFVNLSRSATPFANVDDPEANPVSALPFCAEQVPHDSWLPHRRTFPIGISILLSEHPKRSSRITSV